MRGTFTGTGDTMTKEEPSILVAELKQFASLLGKEVAKAQAELAGKDKYVMDRVKWIEEVYSPKTLRGHKIQWLFNEGSYALTPKAAYEPSDPIDMRLFGTLVIQLINLDTTNDLLYKVEGCLSKDAKWEEIVAETTIVHNAAGDASAVETLASPDDWAYVRVQVKSSSGTIEIKVIAGLKA